MINDLLVQSTESFHEIQLRTRCNQLLRRYSIEELVAMSANKSSFVYTYTSNSLNIEQVKYALLKKYYLSNRSISIGGIDINQLIQEGRFDEVNDLIGEIPAVRSAMLETFLKYKDFSNFSLVQAKRDTTQYEEISNTLAQMNQFYNQKMFVDGISFQKIYK